MQMEISQNKNETTILFSVKKASVERISLMSCYNSWSSVSYNYSLASHCLHFDDWLLWNDQFLGLKWYYDEKIISFFSSDFESVFA